MAVVLIEKVAIIGLVLKTTPSNTKRIRGVSVWGLMPRKIQNVFLDAVMHQWKELFVKLVGTR